MRRLRSRTRRTSAPDARCARSKNQASTRLAPARQKMRPQRRAPPRIHGPARSRTAASIRSDKRAKRSPTRTSSRGRDAYARLSNARRVEGKLGARLTLRHAAAAMSQFHESGVIAAARVAGEADRTGSAAEGDRVAPGLQARRDRIERHGDAAFARVGWHGMHEITWKEHQIAGIRRRADPFVRAVR